MLVQPLTPDGKPRGPLVLAIDGVDAGIGDRVLLVQDGKAAMQVLGRGLAARGRGHRRRHRRGRDDADGRHAHRAAARRRSSGHLDATRPAAGASGLEARVAALEAAVSALGGARRAADSRPPAARPASHPSLQVLGPGGGGRRPLRDGAGQAVRAEPCLPDVRTLIRPRAR